MSDVSADGTALSKESGLRRILPRPTLPGLVKGTWLEAELPPPYPALMTKRDPFKYFKTSREIIRLAVMLYVRFPLSLRNVEDLLYERGIDVRRVAASKDALTDAPVFAAARCAVRQDASGARRPPRVHRGIHHIRC